MVEMSSFYPLSSGSTNPPVPKVKFKVNSNNTLEHWVVLMKGFFSSLRTDIKVKKLGTTGLCCEILWRIEKALWSWFNMVTCFCITNQQGHIKVLNYYTHKKQNEAEMLICSKLKQRRNEPFKHNENINKVTYSNFVNIQVMLQLIWTNFL